jgi:hypothetical protein
LLCFDPTRPCPTGRAGAFNKPMGLNMTERFNVDCTSPVTLHEHLFLVEQDSNVLCRLLGLYATRGIQMEEVHYSHAAPQTMLLTVAAATDADTAHILVSKAASLFGVIEAAERAPRQLARHA